MVSSAPPGVSDERRLEALRRTSLLDTAPEVSFDRLCDLARRTVDAPVALVSLVDGDRQFFKSCVGLDDPYAGERQTPLSHSICQYALASPAPLVIPDTWVDERLRTNGAVTQLGARAYLGVPLVDGDGHILGSFCVIDTKARPWTTEDVATMQDLAASVMSEIELRELVLERDAAHHERSRTMGRLRAVVDSLALFVFILDVDGRIVDANSTSLEASDVALDSIAGRPLWETPWWSVGADEQEQLKLAIERGADGLSSRYDTRIVVTEGSATLDFQLVPLVEDGVVTGLTASGLEISERQRFQADLARLAEIESAQRRQFEDLFALAHALAGALDVDAITHEVADLGGSAVGAALSSIALLTENGELELRLGGGLDEQIQDRWRRASLDLDTPFGQSILTGEPVFVPDADQMAERFPIGLADGQLAGLEALAAAPARSKIRASVGFGWNSPTEFTPALKNVVAIIAELAGQALDRAEVFERQRTIARRLQRSLLPTVLPNVPDVDIAARYEAAAAGLQVGGDWYDVGALSAERWVFAVGDVVGHGLAAAAAMGQLRHAFSALAATASELSSLIELLDQVALEIEDARLTTMVAVELDISTRRLGLVSAGHLPVLLRRLDGTVDRLDGAGPPLGLEVGVYRSKTETAIEPGESFLLYTDGLIERRGSTIDAGLDRLAAAFADAPSTSAEALCDFIVDHMGPSPDDDVAIMAIVA